MKYANGSDFRRAVETRLRTMSQRDGAPLVRLRKLVAFDRLLVRLLHAEPEAWVLKGGLALQLRLGQRARTTKDMDVMCRSAPSDLHESLVDAASLDVNDWFHLVIEQPEPGQEPLPGDGRRYFVRALLDSRPFELFHMDIGIGDPMVEPVQLLTMPALLDFADISPAVVPCFPITQQIAEKTHAYTRPHVSGASSRVKDLVDILLLAGIQPLSGLTLRLALQATFAACDTHPLPSVLPIPPDNWAQPLHRMADETGLAWREIDDTVDAVRQFLHPVLQERDLGTWKSDATGHGNHDAILPWNNYSLSLAADAFRGRIGVQRMDK